MISRFTNALMYDGQNAAARKAAEQRLSMPAHEQWKKLARAVLAALHDTSDSRSPHPSPP